MKKIMLPFEFLWKKLLCPLIKKIIWPLISFLIFDLIVGSILKIYHFAIKPHKYEGLYLFIVSILSFVIFLRNANGLQASQEITILGHFPSWLSIIIAVISIIGAIFGAYIYIYRIILKKTIDSKFYWYIRSFVLLITFFFVFGMLDLLVLNIASRFKMVTEVTENSDFLDTTTYFLKEFGVSFRDGIIVTLELSLLGTLIGLVLALIMVALRLQEVNKRDNDAQKLLKKAGSGFAKLYITIIRGTPMLVQAFVFYYLILSVFQKTLDFESYRDFTLYVWTPFRAGLFTVSINTTAYLTEVLRGGIQSVDKGQIEGARSLGFSKIQTMLFVTFPQAIKNAFPSIGNEFIINIKDTSVLAMIGVMDLFRAGNKTILGSGGFSGKSLEVYMLLAIFYLLLTGITSQILKAIEKKSNMAQKELTSSN